MRYNITNFGEYSLENMVNPVMHSVLTKVITGNENFSMHENLVLKRAEFYGYIVNNEA